MLDACLAMRINLTSVGERRSVRKHPGPWRSLPVLAILACAACEHTTDAPAESVQQASNLKGYPNLAQTAPTTGAVPAAPTVPATPTVPDGPPVPAAPTVSVGSVAPAAPAPSAPAAPGSSPAAAGARAASDDPHPVDRFWPPRAAMAGAGANSGVGPAQPYSTPVVPVPAGPAATHPYVTSTPRPAFGPTAASASFPYSSPGGGGAAAGQRPYDRPLPLAQGPHYTVRGVSRSDVLNVRAAPGAQSPVVGQIPPDTEGVLVTGARRAVGSGHWREISYGEVHGWVNERFLVEERDAP